MNKNLPIDKAAFACKVISLKLSGDEISAIMNMLDDYPYYHDCQLALAAQLALDA